MNQFSEKNAHSNTIIRQHVIYSMAAGLIPVMVVDIVAVTAVQMDMIRQLSRVYGHEFSEARGKAIVAALTGTTIGRMTASSVAKMIPIVGSIVGGATATVFAGAMTYALGQVFKKHFEDGGTILDFDVESLRKMYKEQFEKGKSVAKDWKKENDARKKKGQEGFDSPYFESEVTVDEAPTVIVEENEAVVEEKIQPTEPTDIKLNKDASARELLSRLEQLAAMLEAGTITKPEFDEIKKKLLEG